MDELPIFCGQFSGISRTKTWNLHLPNEVPSFPSNHRKKCPIKASSNPVNWWFKPHEIPIYLLKSHLIFPIFISPKWNPKKLSQNYLPNVYIPNVYIPKWNPQEIIPIEIPMYILNVYIRNIPNEIFHWNPQNQKLSQNCLYPQVKSQKIPKWNPQNQKCPNLYPQEIPKSPNPHVEHLGIQKVQEPPGRGDQQLHAAAQLLLLPPARHAAVAHGVTEAQLLAETKGLGGTRMRWSSMIISWHYVYYIYML